MNCTRPDTVAAARANAVPAWRFTWFPVQIEDLPAEPAPDLAGKRVAVLNGNPQTASRVAGALNRAGAQARVFAPAPDQELRVAAGQWVREIGALDGIVDLGVQADFTLGTADAWEARMRRTVALLQACYEDWRSEEAISRLFYLAVTWIDGLMGYGEGGQQPLGGLWAGLAKTLPQELPNCNIRVLDIAPGEAERVEQRLVSELYRWGLFEVGYCQGRRYTLQARRQELPPASSIPLGPGDVVLFSGGARGIGLLCARAIAERCGSTVVVTGRELPADGSEAWMRLDDAAFKKYGQDQLRRATAQRPPALVRQELTRMQRRRQLRAALDELAAAGLPVQYRVCDVTDPVAVRGLCDELGDALRVVIHNAGVDRPVRLVQKSLDGFVETVRTKVLGFANLWEAVAGRPRLVQFCNVGSLTGRWGGMTGETDYAAANEALARLGLWAQRHPLSCCVKTLVWPTWESVGMITNFAVTKRYVTPMAVDEGVRHWLRELADCASGEVMFMGAVGRALTPIQIQGFSPILDLPNISQLIALHHHAGQPLRFRPFAHFSTHYSIDLAQAPFLHGFRIDGRPAMPASMLIEHACAVAGWVGPEDFRSLVPVALTNILVSLDQLVLPDPAHAKVQLHSEAAGRWVGEDWQVEVRCSQVSTGTELLRLTVVFRDVETPRPDLPSVSGKRLQRLVPGTIPSTQRARWSSHLFPAARWQAPLPNSEPGDRDTVRMGEVAPAQGNDLWALAFPPELRLPIHHLENVLRLLWSAPGPAGESAVTRWRIHRIVLGEAPACGAQWLVQRRDGQFRVIDRGGDLVVELSGVALEGATVE